MMTRRGGEGRLLVRADGVFVTLDGVLDGAPDDPFVGRPYTEVFGTLAGLTPGTEESSRAVQALLDGSRTQFECTYAEGEAFFKLRALRTPEGTVTLSRTDITPLKRAELEFAQLLESPHDALLVVDGSSAICMVNARLEGLFGYSRDELIGRNFALLIPERFRQSHVGYHSAYFQKPHARPMGTGLELFGRRKDGSEFSVEISLTPLTLQRGAFVVAAIRDVSGHKETREQLEQLGARLALHVRQTPLAVVEWDLETRLVTAWNPAAERIFGYRAKEVIGALSIDVLHPDGEPPWLPLGHEEVRGRQTTRNRTADGRIILCEWYVTRLEEGARGAHRGAALGLDVTSRQRALEALISAQDEERRRISRDLHDSVGQALTAIGLGLKAASEHPEAGQLDVLRKLTAATLEEVRRLSRALRPALLDELGLEAAVRQFARELSEQSRTEIDLLVQLPERLAPSEETTVYRVIQEALTNVVRHAHATHASVVLTASGERVRLIVEDDGEGFEPETVSLEHVGLSSMRERIEMLGGTLTIESTPAQGTVVSARFPLQRALPGR